MTGASILPVPFLRPDKWDAANQRTELGGQTLPRPPSLRCVSLGAEGDYLHMPAFSAVETTWHGYRFRSRLEARWAVFFDSLGIEFQYEPEGFRLPNGQWYLPDFFIPQTKTWAEVKPLPLSPEEHWKCEQVALGTNHEILLLVGLPEFQDYGALQRVSLENPSVVFCQSYTYRLDIYWGQPKWYFQEHRFYGAPGEPFSERDCSDRYRSAVFAARAARFTRGLDGE